jgi:hypothetical protein
MVGASRHLAAVPGARDRRRPQIPPLAPTECRNSLTDGPAVGRAPVLSPAYL